MKSRDGETNLAPASGLGDFRVIACGLCQSIIGGSGRSSGDWIRQS